MDDLLRPAEQTDEPNRVSSIEYFILRFFQHQSLRSLRRVRRHRPGEVHPRPHRDSTLGKIFLSP